MSKSHPKPNWLHRTLQRIVVLEPITHFFSSRIKHFDKFLYSATQGHYTFTSLLVGFPIIMITMTGAKTGKKYTVPLVGLELGNELAVIASNFGSSTHPAWYYNLVANSVVTVSTNGDGIPYTARLASQEVYQKIWEEAVGIFPGYEEYRKRAGERKIPIFVLTPVTDMEHVQGSNIPE